MDEAIANNPDSALERRRIQNRMAQRRFRQRKRDKRGAAEQEGQAMDASQGHGNSTALTSAMSSPKGTNLNDYFSEFVLSSPGGSTLSPSGILPTPGGSSVGLIDMFEASLGCESSGLPLGSLGGLFPGGDKASSLDPMLMPMPGGMLETPSRTISSSGRSSISASADGEHAHHHHHSHSHSHRANPSGWLGALHLAARRGHIGIMQVLLQEKLDINERDSDGFTPLMHAVAGGHQDVVTLLLSSGARVTDLDSHRRSVLHLAVRGRSEPLLRLLLTHTRDTAFIDAYDNSGRTALHMAVDAGFEAGVAALLESGANLHTRARKAQ